MLTILSHTPIWVLVIFFTLIYLGLQQSKTRSITFFQAISLPIVMIILSLLAVITSFKPDWPHLSLWAMAAAMSFLIATRYTLLGKISYVSASKRFLMPATWLPLIVMLLIFSTRYAVTVSLSLELPFTQTPMFTLVVCASYGLFCGFFASRLSAIGQSYRQQTLSQTLGSR